MKARTNIPAHKFQQTKSENLNDNLISVLQEYNGGLDGQNMPVEAITADHFVDATTSRSLVGICEYSEYIGTLQSYYQKKLWNVSETALDIWTPVESIQLNSVSWTRGWNRLSAFGTFSDLDLNFNADEGMLTGCAVVDFHRGTDMVYINDGGAAIWVLAGSELTMEWGVFVNNILIAQTGKIYPGRETVQLPFKIPTGSQNITVDIRWRTLNYIVDDDEFDPEGQAALFVYSGSTSEMTTPLDVFGATIWCRSVKR